MSLNTIIYCFVTSLRRELKLIDVDNVKFFQNHYPLLRTPLVSFLGETQIVEHVEVHSNNPQHVYFRCVTNRNRQSSTFLLKPFCDIFPFCLQTYNSDAQIGESSACATALLCGVKANFETVGLDSSGRFQNCFSSFSSRVPSIFDWAQQAGKWNYVNRLIMLMYH